MPDRSAPLATAAGLGRSLPGGRVPYTASAGEALAAPSASGPSLSASLAGEACGCPADLTADEERWLSRVTAERAALGSGETLLVQTHGSSRGRGRAVDGRETAGSESSARLVGHSKAGHLSGQYAYVRRGMPEVRRGFVRHRFWQRNAAKLGSRNYGDQEDGGDAQHVGAGLRAWAARLLCRLRLPPFSLVPGSMMLAVWDAWQGLCALAVLVDAPLHVAYHHMRGYSRELDAALVPFFLLDVLVMSRAAFFENQRGTRQPVLVACPLRIWDNYMKGWFIFDLLPVVGALMVALQVEPVFVGYLLIVLKLTRLVRLGSLSSAWTQLARQRLSKPWKDRIDTSLRLAKVFLVLGGLAHIISCVWYVIGLQDELHHETREPFKFGWVTRGDLTSVPWWRSYVEALYWSVMTLSTVGYGDIPAETWMEQSFAIIVMIVGGMSFAYLVSSLVDIVTAQGVAQRSYGDFMSQVRDYMTDRHVPSRTAFRVISYFEHVYPRERKYDEDDILKELPASLAKDLQVGIYMDLLHNVPVFAAAGEDVMEALCGVLRPFYCAPGDVVCKVGEIAESMFVIVKGELDVFVRYEPEPLPSSPLVSGDVFGLNVVVGLSTRRALTVIANTQCELCVLPRAEVDRLCCRYPQLHAVLHEYAKARLATAKRWSTAKKRKIRGGEGEGEDEGAGEGTDAAKGASVTATQMLEVQRQASMRDGKAHQLAGDSAPTYSRMDSLATIASSRAEADESDIEADAVASRSRSRQMTAAAVSQQEHNTRLEELEDADLDPSALDIDLNNMEATASLGGAAAISPMPPPPPLVDVAMRGASLATRSPSFRTSLIARVAQQQIAEGGASPAAINAASDTEAMAAGLRSLCEQVAELQAAVQQASFIAPGGGVAGGTVK